MGMVEGGQGSAFLPFATPGRAKYTSRQRLALVRKIPPTRRMFTNTVIYIDQNRDSTVTWDGLLFIGTTIHSKK